MGCDIHVRVEYKVPGETVRLVEGDLKVVPAEGLEGAPRWVPAEKLTRKPDQEEAKWYLKVINDPASTQEQRDGAQAAYDRLPEWNLEYRDRWYTGRHYWLFTRLAGVRGNSDDAFWDDRGIPDDASPEVAEDHEDWGWDAHTPSWQTLAELLSKDWTERGSGWRNEAWDELLERMKDLAEWKCDGDQTSVRIVYWFDN